MITDLNFPGQTIPKKVFSLLYKFTPNCYGMEGLIKEDFYIFIYNLTFYLNFMSPFYFMNPLDSNESIESTYTGYKLGIDLKNLTLN